MDHPTLHHHSYRKFKDTPISTELLDHLMECAMRAPNTGNMQMYSIVVTQQEPLRSQLLALHYNQCSTAPVIVTFCADVDRYHRWCRISGCDEPYSNLLWMLSGTIDASLAAENFNIAAEAAGLGCCHLGTVLYNAQSISQLLQLPQGVMPVITLALGYPDEEGTPTERLPLEAVVHHETYHHATDEEVAKLHAPREQYPFNQEMVKLNQCRNLAELFTTKRYPRSANEEISATLLQLLRQNGFLPEE